jgi:hypothetical protein
LDIGEQDDAVTPASVREFDRILTLFKVPHSFETYPGNHVNRVAERVQMQALPFFSKNLSFSDSKH